MKKNSNRSPNDVIGTRGDLRIFGGKRELGEISFSTLRVDEDSKHGGAYVFEDSEVTDV
jgi:hypothetical protein